MNKKIILKIIAILVSAILLNGCGLNESTNNEIALDEASKNWSLTFGEISEFGHCNDGWDNDGDGLPDTYDSDCHLTPGPIRDNSFFSFGVGHNFFPDVSKDLPGGPGWAGDFRDRALFTRWFRFLTDPYGDIAAINLMGPAVDPSLIPVPAPLEAPALLGTAAQGNNNNPDPFLLHTFYLEHGFLPGMITPPIVVPAIVDPFIASGIEYIPTVLAPLGGPFVGPGVVGPAIPEAVVPAVGIGGVAVDGEVATVPYNETNMGNQETMSAQTRYKTTRHMKNNNAKHRYGSEAVTE